MLPLPLLIPAGMILYTGWRAITAPLRIAEAGLDIALAARNQLKSEAPAQPEGLNIGDHLAVARTSPIPYVHHGIYAGELKVIHYSGDLSSKQDASICEASLNDFAGGDAWGVVEYKTCLSSDEVLSRARGRLGEKEYNIALQNCEHFATWCKTGSATSSQGNNLRITASSALTLVSEAALKKFFGI